MRKILLIGLLLFLEDDLCAQTKIIKGTIKDDHSDEPVPFASIRLPGERGGLLADSAGSFIFRISNFKKGDSLTVQYIGYAKLSAPIPETNTDTIEINFRLERSSIEKNVVIKSKYGKGWILWRRMVKYKPLNDRYRFDNFGYELYNKLEIDINRINTEKFKNFRLLRPFGEVIEKTVDSTSEEKPFLPVFLTETISDYYYQKDPLRRREEIKASKTSGIKNESVQKLLGGMDQVVNVYNNFILVFDKRFISPISDNGDAFYYYRLTDTQYIGGKRFFHLVFTPKHKGENTFEGDCWVHDTTYAVQKMNLRLSKDANINYVEKLSLVQEYRMLDDSLWFLSKDKFIVDIAPIGKEKFGVIGRKTTTYRDVKINSGEVWESVRKNKKLEETILETGASDQNEEYWKQTRHEELDKNEKAIYAMIDTLQQMSLFKKYSQTAQFLATGYKPLGKLEYGPWFNIMSANVVEGFRTRLDLGTSSEFSKKWWLRGYLAYGTLDRKFKGRAEVTYLFRKNPRTRLYATYANDYDNGQVYYDEVGTDNVFMLAARKSAVPIKFFKVEQQRIDFLHETNSGFSFELSTARRQFTPIRALPDKSIFGTGKGEPLNNFEVSAKIRFAYLERFLEGSFLRTSLGSPYPITEIKYTKGFSGILRSNYDYHKLTASVHDYQKVSHYGELYYNIYGGKIWGTLPFMLLEMHPGNEIYYYNKYAFNLMNRFEFLSDEFAGINLEHNIGNGIFRLLSPTRKMKLRQFWTAKVLWGQLNNDNRALNQVGTIFRDGHRFETLNDRTYMELGTGVDNIFRLLRIDLIWRVLPQPLPVESYKRFGIFGSFRLQF
jgi:hypothetical protein